MTESVVTSKILDEYKNDERPRHIGQFKTVEEEVRTTATENAIEFAEQATTFIDEYQRLHNILVSNSKKIY